ncbi:hypothetical protein C5167_011744 [Papaver somniferum]|nr:hypothetical protein C5167_011744 [Papaver somniferum]
MGGRSGYDGGINPSVDSKSGRIKKRKYECAKLSLSWKLAATAFVGLLVIPVSSAELVYLTESTHLTQSNDYQLYSHSMHFPCYV